MFCEIEFAPVGEASKPGDAIIVRYGDPQNYELMLVDGGTNETGEKLVAHLKKHFGEHVQLAHVVLTHSDADHACGLREILGGIPVGKLWLHIPWLVAADARHLFKNKSWTVANLEAAIKKEYDLIGELVDLATEANVEVSMPFQGASIGPFRVLSPSRQTYVHLVPQFDRTPDPDQEAIEAAGLWIGKQPSTLAKILEKIVSKAQKWVTETWDHELLKDGGITSASNESSVILYGDFGDNRRVLLTGDGGVRALTWAADYAEKAGLVLQRFSFTQIPHHGSRRNVGPTILNRILGPIQPETAATRFTAFVSAPEKDDTHPRKMVLNAFKRRGARVIATQGNWIIHYGGFPMRDGYKDAQEISFSTSVEAYD